MSDIIEAIRRVNRTSRVEESLRLRQVILASVMVAVLGTLASGAAPALDGIAALVLLPVGAWVSYQRRGRENMLLKALLALAAVLALSRFFGDVRSVTSIEDTRQPLAALFLSIQVLHGFDLPARRDLGFTLVSSLTLIALSASSTHAGIFGLLLIVYGTLAVVALLEIQRSAARQRADELSEEHDYKRLADSAETSVVATSSSWSAETVTASAKMALPVLLIGALAFSLLPRSDTTQLGGLPFKGFPASLRLPSSAITNPGLDAGGLERPTDGSAPIGFNPTAYFGFAENVDLRTVGQLSDDPVLRVRADRPRFWRGIVFDTYSGVGWSRSTSEPPPTFGAPVRLRNERYPAGEYVRVTQTFELLEDTPNLIFNAGEAAEVYLAGGSVNQWADGTLTTAQIMDRETVYSVVSSVNLAPRSAMLTATGPVPPDIEQQYTQLPRTVTDRTHELAASLTQGAATNYSKAVAIESWIGANTQYTLDAAPPPNTGDVVDYFLFDARKGWCEPIASSMVVMLRSVGVPARFATGFQPGTRNAITGVFDVRMSNAHAWVEVFIPNHGWVSFDPTGAVPEAVDGRSIPTIPLIDAITWVRGKLAALIPMSVRTWLGDRWPVVLTGLLALVLGFATRLLLRRRERRVRAAAPPADPFGRLVHLMRVEGIVMDDWQTPREFIRRIALHRPDLPGDALGSIGQYEERRRYDPATGADANDATTAFEVVSRAVADAHERAEAAVPV